MATDNFNRADSGTLGANYAATDSNMQIVSNRAVGLADAAVNIVYRSAEAFSNDQYSEATLYHGGTSRSLLCVRVNGSGDLYYADVNVDTASTTLWKRVSGSYTQIGGNFGAPTNGLVYKLEVIGTTLKIYQGGVQMSGSETDSSIASGKPGIGAIASSEGWDDWTGDSIGGVGGTTKPAHYYALMRQH